MPKPQLRGSRNAGKGFDMDVQAVASASSHLSKLGEIMQLAFVHRRTNCTPRSTFGCGWALAAFPEQAHYRHHLSRGASRPHLTAVKFSCPVARTPVIARVAPSPLTLRRVRVRERA